MEFNKEEAIRAKEIAEKKLQNKDFLGAHRIALKAHKLYPDLDNLSQMLVICEVHYSAEHRISEDVMDWYSILQIHQTADEATIKKQYRKFALLLHPDKNNLPGAEAAFKLIGQAQRVLTDQRSRSFYDMIYYQKARSTAPSQSSLKASKSSDIRKNVNKQHQHQRPPPTQQTQSANPQTSKTFWTKCSFCYVKFLYYTDALNKSLCCQCCSRPFIANDIGFEGIPPRAPAYPLKKVPSWDFFEVEPQSANVYPSSIGDFQGKFGINNSAKESPWKTRCTSDASMAPKTGEKCESVNVRVGREEESNKIKQSIKVSGKRKRDPDEIIIEQGVILPKSTIGPSKEQCPRRSHNRQFVSYPKRAKRSMLPSFKDESVDKTSEMSCGHGLASTNEENKEDEMQGTVAFGESFSYGNIDCKETNEGKAEGSVVKTSSENEDESQKGVTMKMNGLCGLAATNEENDKDGVQKKEVSGESLSNVNSNIEESDKKETVDKVIENCSEAVNGSASNVAKPEQIPVLYHPDFSNFERGDDCFEVGQIWACYDTWDAMPRFYARINRVFLPGFKLQVSWLDAAPDEEDEIEWVNEELPVSCGKFVDGITTDITEDPLMFSHLVSWEKGSMWNSFYVYPKTGETWALFKNWDIKWKSDTDRKSTVQYEYVEVLSDYVEGPGVCVANLSKLKGFTCLFCKLVQGPNSSFQIPSTQLYRFSHQVPSFRMTGEEREDVPRESFELDPASLPPNLGDIPVVENYEMETKKTNFNGSCQDLATGMGSNGSTSVHQVEEANWNVKNRSSDNVQNFVADHPVAEFYDFDADRSNEQFQAGQIWALYGDEDAMPRYYCQIKKFKSHPNVQVQIEWLAANLLKGMVPWCDDKMPLCCGSFFCVGEEPQVYDMTSAFSHQLRADRKKGEYIIVPRKGEVWALYKEWNVNMTCSDLLSCEYEIVEILRVKGTSRKVLALERVAGFNTVFKAQVRENIPVMMEIPGRQMLRFSHMIPSFRLRKERDGSLSGFWELDPASLPIAFFKPKPI